MNSHQGWGLAPSLLDRVWPFHIVLDPDLAIMQVGSSLRRVCPGVVPGRDLGGLVEVVSPAGALTWQALKSRPQSLFVLKMRENDLILRGQMLHDEETGVLHFVGSPWITELAALAPMNLTLEDFSVSDNIVDYLLLLQTQATGLAQARTLAESLEQSSRELKSHARQLERITWELNSVLNSAGEGIYGTDAKGCIAFVNEAAARLLNLPRADMLGRKADEVIHSEASPAPGSPEVVTAESEPARPVIGRHRRGDGSWFDSEVISAPILEDGDVVGAVVVFRDITERRAVDRMKDEFISMVSHELRTPLTSIRGALGLLSAGDTGELAPPAARMVEVATMSTDRLIRLINDILEVERMAAGKLVINYRNASAQSLVQATVEEMTGLAQSSGVHIRIGEIAGNVWADPDLIVQTLSNLLGNAIKFSEPGDTVELGATLDMGDVRFDVRDTGPGVPPDQLESIFEPFNQVDGSDTRAKGGSGLGLAICRGLVERQDGRIWATSQFGEGTTISFTLAAVEPQPVAPVRRLMVVDDEPMTLEVTKLSLELAGWSVITASNGQEAIDLATSELPDAILMDVMMPVMDGPSACLRLAEISETSEIPIVLFTAKAQLSEQRHWATLPVAGVLVKPFDPQLLAPAVSDMLGWDSAKLKPVRTSKRLRAV